MKKDNYSFEKGEQLVRSAQQRSEKSKEERPVVRPGEKPLEAPEPEAEAPVQEFHPNDIVKVQGSDTRWKVRGINKEKNTARLEREDFNFKEHTAYGKVVPLKDLEKVIEPETITEPDFKGAKNFEELYAEIDRVGSVQGSEKFYSAKELKDVIDQVRNLKAGIRSITNTGGLRDRVAELIRAQALEEGLKKEKTEMKFKPHQMVQLRKEDGTLEPDWEIINILEEQGKQVARIRKEEADRRGQKMFSQKKVPLSELAE